LLYDLTQFLSKNSVILDARVRDTFKSLREERIALNGV
jgi:hypothetical protein